MLNYLGSGTRDYLKRPVWPYTRGGWEFQAFMRGGARLMLAGGREEAQRERVMYVCGPGCVHGWMGNGRASEVAVFHFAEVPKEVAALTGGTDGWVAVNLDAGAEEVLRRLLREAQREAGAPRASSPLHYQRIAIELSLEVLRLAQPAPGAREKAKVDAVIAWYLERLQEGPTLEEAARAHAVSVAHLRRLFHRVTGRGPQEVLAQMRFQRAAALVRDTQQPLAEIAAELGFSEPSAFTRAFRLHYGVMPSAWR